MRVICVCQKGNSRSVGMAWYLRNAHEQNHETLAVGMKTASLETLDMLFRWAEMIILLAPQYRKSIPSKYDAKVEVCGVGHDTYFKKHSDSLMRQCKAFADKTEML